MTPERWAEVDKLLDAALARPDDERQKFLDEACGDDGELRQELDSLLAAHVKAEARFLKTPALEVAAQQFATAKNRSLIGETIGHYNVISVLGIGGMGEVYLARDSRLERNVALKLLPAQYTQDAGRIKRFEREARAASALNHPNIITIYEIGEIEDKHFIAAEHIEGRTLREILTAGPLTVKEALEIAVQICAALAAAHDAGIIHRDIKPENIMVRRDGFVKVLDFGLVKLTEQHRSAGHTNASEGDPAKTNPGAVLGTAKYMSPEQALAQDVDRRSDIFSLGVTLYELLSGVPPFKGDRMAAVLDAIVHHQQASLSLSRPDLHPELDRIISRALEKDRDLRYQTASDLRSELKLLQREMDSSPSHSLNSSGSGSKGPIVPVPGNGRNKVWLALTAVVLIAAALLTGLWLASGRNSNDLSWSRAVASRLTSFGGAELFPAFSPDGKEFVYARNEKNNWDIYQQRLSGSLARNLTANSPDDDTQPAYSPNGEWIAFRSERRGGGIYVMGASGESVRQISDMGYYPDWSPNGIELVFSSALVIDPASRGSNGKLYIVNFARGQPREIKAGRDVVQPRWSPNGKRIAYWGKDQAAQRDIWTVSPQGGDAIQVTNDPALDWNPVWSPDGSYIYFISDRNGAPSLWRVAVDQSSGRPAGKPEPIIGPLAQSWQLNISPDGRRLVFVERQLRENLFSINFDPNKLETIGVAEPVLEGSARSSAPDVSPDGQWLTYYSRGEASEDIFVIRTDGTSPSQLTNDPANDRLPRWTADNRILFYSKLSGSYEIWSVNPDGSGRQQISFNKGQPAGINGGTSIVYPVLSPDRQWISYCVAGGETFLLDARKSWNEQKPVALPLIKTGEMWFIAWSWSPDSKKLAGWASDRNDEYNVSYVYSLESQQYEKIADVGQNQYWLNDNRHLICVEGDKIYLLDTQTKQKRSIHQMPQRVIRSLSISPDNRRIYYSLVRDESDIRLLTLE